MIKKIIVRLPNWIGDLVMATPVLTDLRTAFPDSTITAMAPAAMLDLLQNDPAIDDCLGIQKLRDSYDLGILLPHSFSSAWLFWRGDVKRRLGFSGDGRSLLLTDPVKRPREKMHQVEYYKHLLRKMNIPISSSAPKLYLSEPEIAQAKEKFDLKGRPLIGINPGAAYGSAKCWPMDRFQELALRLVKQGRSVVFFGSAPIKLEPSVINLSGLTTLRELACLIDACDLLITNDSGPMHIAAALNTPVVALFGSTDETRTGPWGQPDAVVSCHASCSPCFKRTCPLDFRCMKQISVDEVMKKVNV